MKLVIDISQNDYEEIKEYGINTFPSVAKAIQNGIPYKEISHKKWEYLKEHITELRDANGYATQYGTCQFILNLMGVIENEGESK